MGSACIYYVELFTGQLPLAQSYCRLLAATTTLSNTTKQKEQGLHTPLRHSFKRDSKKMLCKSKNLNKGRL